MRLCMSKPPNPRAILQTWSELKELSVFHLSRLISAGCIVVLGLSLAGCKPQSEVPNVKKSSEQNAEAVDPSIEKELQSLPEADRVEAIAQKICPVSGEPLGSMGAPVKVAVKDTSVFICCESCRKKLLGDPDTYLGKLGR
jgi:hypothetical protein